MNFKDYLKSLELKDENLVRDMRWLACSILKKKLHEINSAELTNKQQETLNNGVEKLKQNMPLNYITNSAPFYGLDFYVDENVLIPRMETEMLVEKIIVDNKNAKNLKILDLCTGSGCIAITLKKHLDCSVFASDFSESALKIAKNNAKTHKTDITFIKSDMFKKILDKFDIIVSNPPYIKKSEIEKLDDSVKNFEPYIALDGGNDGLDFYRKIADLAPKFLNKNGKLYLEIGFDQGQSVPKLLENNFKNIEIFKDLDNNDRIVKCFRR